MLVVNEAFKEPDAIVHAAVFNELEKDAVPQAFEELELYSCVLYVSGQKTPTRGAARALSCDLCCRDELGLLCCGAYFNRKGLDGSGVKAVETYPSV